MPGRNGRGPQGEGPRTGRGMGRCRPATGSETDDTTRGDGEANAVFGAGMAWRNGQGGGRGMGRGRGLGRGGGRGMGRGAGWGGQGRGGPATQDTGNENKED